MGEKPHCFFFLAKKTPPPSPPARTPPVPLTLYPAIDLKDGACVRLRRGDMDAGHRVLGRPRRPGPRLAGRRLPLAARGGPERRLRRPLGEHGGGGGDPGRRARARAARRRAARPCGGGALAGGRRAPRGPGQRRRARPRPGARVLPRPSRARRGGRGRARRHGGHGWLGRDLHPGGRRARAALRGLPARRRSSTPTSAATACSRA